MKENTPVSKFSLWQKLAGVSCFGLGKEREWLKLSTVLEVPPSVYKVVREVVKLSVGVMSWDLRERLMTGLRRKFKASDLGECKPVCPHCPLDNLPILRRRIH